MDRETFDNFTDDLLATLPTSTLPHGSRLCARAIMRGSDAVGVAQWYGDHDWIAVAGDFRLDGLPFWLRKTEDLERFLQNHAVTLGEEIRRGPDCDHVIPDPQPLIDPIAVTISLQDTGGGFTAALLTFPDGRILAATDIGGDIGLYLDIDAWNQAEPMKEYADLPEAFADIIGGTAPNGWRTIQGGQP